MEVVNKWLELALGMQIETIICLLSVTEMRKYYTAHGIDLLQQYRARGLNVIHFPVRDHQEPPLSAQQTSQLCKLFAGAKHPVLIHCSAGIDRTGMSVDAIIKTAL